MKRLLVGLALLPALIASAQKIEQNLDYSFKPLKVGTPDWQARYHAVTEKREGGWYKQALYVPERKVALDGWYKDAEGKTSNGPVKWYYPNGQLQSTGAYDNGLKQGSWLEWDEQGHLVDSATYAAGKIRGVHLKWYDDGKLWDSSWFDAAGNGVQKGWSREGQLTYQGSWTADTVKSGQWKHYYSRHGQLRLVEDYAAGKVVSKSCYDTLGKPLTNCEEKEAVFPGDIEGWRRFLERNLNASVPVDKGAPAGYYTVVVQFIVDVDGSISNVKALTNNGYGTEEEVVRLIEKGPKWIPAQMFGSPVRAYRKQPITFVVWEEPAKKKRGRG